PWVIALLTFLLMIGDPRIVAGRHRNLTSEYAKSCADIERMQVTMGKWVAAGTPSGAVIGTFDAGAITYFGGRETVDILGLNTPHIAPLSPRLIEKLDYLITYPGLSEGAEKPYKDREIWRINLPDATNIAGTSMVVYQVKPEPAVSPPENP
ncbi:MAG: hypothetical protein ACTSXZ_06735, partial [Alphaproteobacteria bacterium]